MRAATGLEDKNAGKSFSLRSVLWNVCAPASKKNMTPLLRFISLNIAIFIFVKLMASCTADATSRAAVTETNKNVAYKFEYDTRDSCKKYTEKLSAYAEEHGYNDRLFFILDLEKHSGKERFFVYDHKADSVLAAGLVAHGQGKKMSTQPAYSNVEGSYCSSRGKYIIGESYIGKFGLAYKLHGKDASNSNALARFVVLHAHECIPDASVYPAHICQSQGCPTVSPLFLKTLEQYIKESELPIILRII